MADRTVANDAKTELTHPHLDRPLTHIQSGILQLFIADFRKSHSEFFDPQFKNLTPGLYHESPALNLLPQTLLDQLGKELRKCSVEIVANLTDDCVERAAAILQCLVLLCRNYDNVFFVASCDFVSQSVNSAQAILSRLYGKKQSEQTQTREASGNLVEFIETVFHFLECLYDPYFIWRKRLKGWPVDVEQVLSKPAVVHNEIIPFFHECFQISGLSNGLQKGLLHLFGAIMSGAETNAVLVVTPASVDVVLSVLSGTARCCQGSEGGNQPMIAGDEDLSGGAERSESPGEIQVLLLRCVVSMVHTLHLSAADQGQVEVYEVVSSFLQVLQSKVEAREDVETIMYLIDALVKMTDCSNRLTLQALLSVPNTFQSLMFALRTFSDDPHEEAGANSVQWDPVPNQQFKSIARSVIQCLQALMRGSTRSKKVFEATVGYTKLSTALQSCGQPDKDMLSTMLDWAVEGCYADMREPVLKSPQVAVLLVKWLSWVTKAELQIWLSERLLRLCSCSYSNRMACCKVGMVTELLSLLAEHSKLQLKTTGDVISLLERLGGLSISASELKQVIELVKPAEDEENAISIPGSIKWPGHSFSFFCWLRLEPLPNLDSYEEKVSLMLHRRVLYSFSTSAGLGFEAFVCPDLRFTVATFSKKEFHSVLVEGVSLDDGLWHSVCVVHTPGRRFSGSVGHVAVYIDGKSRLNAPLKFPSLTEPFTACYIGSPSNKSNSEPINDVPVCKTPEVKKVSPLKSLFWFGSRSHHAQQNSSTEPTAGQSGSGSGMVTTNLSQEDARGPAISLHGQIESVCVFHDAVLQEQAKTLSLIGPNSLLHFSDDPAISDLSGKLFVRYSAKACQGSVCADLSGHNHPAIFSGDIITTHDVKVSPDLVDVNVLMSVQYLVEDSDDHSTTKSTLLQHIYHYILFDFSLWSRTQFAVRIGHIQYLSTIIKDDRKFFRKKYGVQFFLDIVRQYYRVYEKSKARLRLTDIGHWGLVNLMTSYDISAPMIKRFLEQVCLTDTPQMYGAVLAILGLVHNCGLDIKSEASRQLLALLVSRSNAPKGFAKQLGWQENVTRLLTMERRQRTFTLTRDSNPAATGADNSGSERETTSSERETTPDVSSGDDVDKGKRRSSSNSRPHHLSLSTISERSHHRNSVGSGQDVTPSSSDLDLLGDPVATTPLYMKRREFIDIETPDTDDVEESRSSSASLEDLLGGKDSPYSRKHNDNGSISSSSNTTGGKGNNNNSAEFVSSSVSSLSLDSSLSESMSIATDSGFGIGDQMAMRNSVSNTSIHGSITSATSTLRSSVTDFSSAFSDSERRRRSSGDNILEDRVDHRRTSSVLQSDGFKQVLLGVGVDLTNDAVEQKEELCQNVLIIILTIMWKGLDGSSKDIWKLVSSATVKLHSLVQTKLISSSAEASYILGVLNQMIMQALEGGTDNYSYLMPVLRALIDKGEELLTISTQLPHLPQTSMSPTFFDDFKIYTYSEEWQHFISNYIGPQMIHFMETNLEEGDGSLTQFWSQCHEDMMMSHHRHNREIGESRLKFKNQISETYRKKVDVENRRFQNTLAQIKNQHLFAMKNWRATKRFFVGDRGAWRKKHQEVIHWKLSNQENFARMKLKLMQNYSFDTHVNASRLRDNMGVIETENTIKLEEMETLKKALVSRENIADDSLGDEEWSAISASSALQQEEYTGKEKLVISSDCQLITVMDEVKGRLEVTTTHVYFFDCNPRREEEGEDFKWSLSRLREIHFRRYNLRRTSLEMFFIDQTNYFINFPDKTLRNKIYSSILSLRPPNLIYKGQRSSGDLLRASGLTQKWVNREISNFEYLMQLNTIAGRSYNDLSQYHVFPWILVDYTSEHLDLENPAVFRDLSRPIGVVNPKNEDEVREK
ncbi:neurobeachin-like protein 1 [Elysia marginata]|uniref:Neurobeachin-like protein 1 n=1 Tax=Elysia marginata TaxID=1093978 RepID=A0AAV4FT27_9GAST|nr:neurobeachin-like protein 1 [Elysia marginata]